MTIQLKAEEWPETVTEDDLHPTCDPALCVKVRMIDPKTLRFAVVRRHSAAHHDGQCSACAGPRSTTYIVGDMTINTALRVLHRHGVAVHLTLTEWDLLLILVRAGERVISAAEIYRLLRPDWPWDDNLRGSHHLIGVHLCRLRPKLAPGAIETRPGIGYRLAIDQEAQP